MFMVGKARWRFKSAEKGKYEILDINSLDSLNLAKYWGLMDSKGKCQLFFIIAVI